jgi:hypothetical protein
VKEIKMALAKGHKLNFNTLADAFDAGRVALMECQLAATGEAVAVICAANRLPDGEIEFAPFAMLFNDNPYKMVNPPNIEGGFFRREEIGQ